jgi:hypothetical protein
MTLILELLAFSAAGTIAPSALLDEMMMASGFCASRSNEIS